MHVIVAMRILVDDPTLRGKGNGTGGRRPVAAYRLPGLLAPCRARGAHLELGQLAMLPAGHECFNHASVE